MLDQELSLEELIYLRWRCAMVHSKLLRSNKYASQLVPLLNAFKVKPHVPLHRNEEAVMRGDPVRHSLPVCMRKRPLPTCIAL